MPITAYLNAPQPPTRTAAPLVGNGCPRGHAQRGRFKNADVDNKQRFRFQANKTSYIVKRQAKQP